MGDMLGQLERYDEALAQFRKAISIAPRDPQTHYALGMFYERQGDRTGRQGWYNKALLELEQVRMIDSKYKDVSTQLAELKKKR